MCLILRNQIRILEVLIIILYLCSRLYMINYDHIYIYVYAHIMHMYIYNHIYVYMIYIYTHKILCIDCSTNTFPWEIGWSWELVRKGNIRPMNIYLWHLHLARGSYFSTRPIAIILLECTRHISYLGFPRSISYSTQRAIEPNITNIVDFAHL